MMGALEGDEGGKGGMMLVVYSGQMVSVEATFRVSGAPSDPSGIVVTLTVPGSGVTGLAYPAAGTLIQRRGTGVYALDWVCRETGQYRCHWVGSGVQAASATAWGVLG